MLTHEHFVMDVKRLNSHRPFIATHNTILCVVWMIYNITPVKYSTLTKSRIKQNAQASIRTAFWSSLNWCIAIAITFANTNRINVIIIIIYNRNKDIGIINYPMRTLSSSSLAFRITDLFISYPKASFFLISSEAIASNLLIVGMIILIINLKKDE